MSYISCPECHRSFEDNKISRSVVNSIKNVGKFTLETTFRVGACLLTGSDSAGKIGSDAGKLVGLRDYESLGRKCPYCGHEW